VTRRIHGVYARSCRRAQTCCVRFAMLYKSGLDRTDQGNGTVDPTSCSARWMNDDAQHFLRLPWQSAPGVGGQHAPPDSLTSTGNSERVLDSVAMLRRVPRAVSSGRRSAGRAAA
jgi:hypothetical protein